MQLNIRFNCNGASSHKWGGGGEANPKRGDLLLGQILRKTAWKSRKMDQGRPASKILLYRSAIELVSTLDNLVVFDHIFFLIGQCYASQID